MVIRRVLPVLLAIVTVFFVSFIGLPIFIETDDLQKICTLPRANAQDNPCLAQEATLSAMQVQLQQVAFQGTLDAINHQATLEAMDSSANDGIDYQATIAALQTEVEQLNEALATGGSSSVIPIAGLPLNESFDTNLLGWDLTPTSAGIASFSRGQLRLTANSRQPFWRTIPTLTLGDEFFIETDVTPRDYNMFVGFALGNAQTGQFHLFGVYERCCGVRTWVEFYNNQTPLFSTEYEQIWSEEQTVKFGLEARNGLHTLFINGETTETSQITPYGGDLGFVVFATTSGERSAAFDNVVVRQSR